MPCIGYMCSLQFPSFRYNILATGAKVLLQNYIYYSPLEEQLTMTPEEN